MTLYTKESQTKFRRITMIEAKNLDELQVNCLQVALTHLIDHLEDVLQDRMQFQEEDENNELRIKIQCCNDMLNHLNK